MSAFRLRPGHFGRVHRSVGRMQDGLSVEFMILEFAEAAKLYVPLTRLDLIQKYRSTDAGPAPVLNRRWN